MRNCIVLLIIIFTSCADIKETSKPDDFYGDEKMVDIMTDLYLMESSMTSNRALFTDLQMLPHDFIYEKYNTDSLTFAQNLFYYSDRNTMYKNIMEQVKERIDVLKDTIDLRQKMQSERERKLYNGDSIITPLEIDPENS